MAVYPRRLTPMGYQQQQEEDDRRRQNMQQLMDIYKKIRQQQSPSGPPSGSPSVEGGFLEQPDNGISLWGEPNGFALEQPNSGFSLWGEEGAPSLFGEAPVDGSVATESILSGGPEGGMGSGGGMGAAAPVGYIAAAILGQMAAANNTGFEFEGVKTGDVFNGLHLDQGKEQNWSPHFGTEPWYAFAQSKLFGNDRLPTAGESFDAAVANGDTGEALSRLPAVANYWANPIGSWLGYDTLQNVMGSDLAGVVDPLGWLVKQIGDWF